MAKIKTIFLDEIDSTNDYAKRISDRERDDILIIAKKQTAGKGRLGRKFFSPESGIYMSLLLHPDFSAGKTDRITVMAAVAVARAIESVFGISTSIKWVNDIYIGNKKVCGILCEGVINPNCKKIEYAVLGIGVNLSPPRDGFPDDIKDIATYLKDSVSDFERKSFSECFVNKFYEIYEGKSEYMTEYKVRSNVLGKKIEYIKNGAVKSGTAVDIGDNGELIVKDENGISILTGGEIKISVNSLF